MQTLGDVVEVLHGWYPPGSAEHWDAVGLVSGDPDQPATKVLLAVDPTLEVAEEAVAWGADLLVVHHPLFLKPVHGVAAITPKGRTLATLIRGNCALLTAHTNADLALGGVSEALALRLGLSELTPILPAPAEALDSLTVHVPLTAADAVRRALAEAGAGQIGAYDSCSYSTPGQGRFRPLAGASPAIGVVGQPEVVAEEAITVVLPRALRGRVVAAMLAAHPYEEPAYGVVELADAAPNQIGTGRIGRVPPTTLAEFAATVAGALPATAQGIRVAGDPHRPVRTVAVCGGAGDFLLDQLAGADVDVYLTSDLRHHPAAEFVEKGGPALIDVAHWAAESTWLDVLAARLAEDSRVTVETRVSTRVTDPWTMRLDQPFAGAGHLEGEDR